MSKRLPFIKGEKISPIHKKIFSSTYLIILGIILILILIGSISTVGITNIKLWVDNQMYIQALKVFALIFVILSLIFITIFISKRGLFFRKSIAVMIERQGYRTKIQNIGSNDVYGGFLGRPEEFYYPTFYFRPIKKGFRLYVKLDGTKFQNDFTELNVIIEPMLDVTLKNKEVIKNYCVYDFEKNKYNKRLIVKEDGTDLVSGDMNINLGSNLNWNVEKVPHALITGGTGSGKTYFIFYIIKELMKMDSIVKILDPKESDLKYLGKFMGDENCAYDTTSILKQLRFAEEEMSLRNNQIFDNEDVNLGDTFKAIGLKPYYVIFDEFPAFISTLANKEKKEVQDRLTNIIMKGRQSGVFVLLTAQRPDADVISGSIRDQLGLRIGLGNMSDDGFRMLFGSKEVEYKTISKSNVGAGYVFIDGVTSVPNYFEAPYLKNFDLVEYIKQKYNKGVEESEENALET